MGLDALLKRLTETPETPHVSPDVSPEPAWIKAETCETPETCGITIITSDATYWHWLLHFADREPLEVYCNPDATHAEILERYPGALAAEPIPEPPKPVLSPSEKWYFIGGGSKL